MESVKICVCKGGAWERVDGALEYMPLNCVKRTLILLLLSSYSCLLEAVSERLKIDANSDFIVTYNLDNDIVEVCDDLKVNEFMKFVVKSSTIVTLCIAEFIINGRQSSNSGSNQQSNFIHATPSVNVYQTKYHATQIHQTQTLVFPGGGGFYQNLSSYQQMHGFSGNPMYVSGFPGYPMQDPQSDSANRKQKQVVVYQKNKKPNERDLLDDEKLRPFGEKIMGSVLGKVKDYLARMRVVNLIRTFVLHMRPLIIIDGAHLKGEFLGAMYLAVAMDGNNQILPLAYGVGKSETFRSWDWFLTKLKECVIGKQDHLTIISDGAVSIASAIKNVFPNAFHGRCCRHFLMNLREKCPKFISKEELF
uniref:MULE transposase domain-containing protein n=1 Tax=Tanacetum cinerariifolium TaxID=118510 RepID=A0A6L2MAJ3_TANCI|nr:hypothetical protein [Tanacetum cinerariifolium]